MLLRRYLKYGAFTLLGCTVFSAHAVRTGVLGFTGQLDLTDTWNFSGWGDFKTGPWDAVAAPYTRGHMWGTSLLDPGPRDQSGFIHLKSAPQLMFTLTNVAPALFGSGSCNAPAAVGQSCSPANTALNFTNVAYGNSIGTTMSFSLSGEVLNTNKNTKGSFSGIITAVFPYSYQSVLDLTRDNVGNTTSWSYAAMLHVNAPTAAPVPEPANWALMGCGSIVVGAVGWRRRRKQAPA